MRYKLWIIALALGGCGSSVELRSRAEQHMQAAEQASAAGDYRRTVDEQRRAEHLYQRADARAFEEGRAQPPPPETQAPLPLFDPNMQRKGPARSQLEQP